MLDSILYPEWQYRYYSFNAHWAAGEAMASMRDGCGDSCFILFTGSGAIMKGFAHESVISRGVLEQGETPSGYLWRRNSDLPWQVVAHATLEGDDPDGSADLMYLLDGDPEGYRTWAEDYFETPVVRWTVDHLFEDRPLTEKVVIALNPKSSQIELAEDISEIAYPIVV